VLVVDSLCASGVLTAVSVKIGRMQHVYLSLWSVKKQLAHVGILGYFQFELSKSSVAHARVLFN